MKGTCVPLAAWPLPLPEPPSGPSSLELPALQPEGPGLVLGARDPGEGHREEAFGAGRLPGGEARSLTGIGSLTPLPTTLPPPTSRQESL